MTLQQPPPPLRGPRNAPRGSGKVNPAVTAYFDYSQSRTNKRSVPMLGFTNLSRGVLGNDIAPFRAGVNDSTIEPPGSLPVHIKGRLSGWGEPPNLSSHLDTQKIQNALRAAERGEMTLLFQCYRDYLLQNTHLQSEFSKRKMSVIGQPYSLKPYKARDEKEARPENVQACKVIETMIEDCEDWLKGLVDLMDATLYPLSACEKITEPNTNPKKPWIRIKLKSLDPVSPFLMSFKLPYLAAGGFQLPMNVPNVIAPNAIPLQLNEPGDTIWNPDTWEPDLRFFRTFPNGFIDYSWANMYAPDPMRHLIHRGDILSGAIRDNYGGVMRATLFWSFFALDARTKFAQAMNKYGSPFVLAKANMADINTLNFLQDAFKRSAEIGGMLVNKDADVQMIQAMQTNMAQGWELFLKFCNSEISKLVIGHEMSSGVKPGGLNEGETKQAGEVREDIRIFDQAMLRVTLRRLFRWYLDINGYFDCECPQITWGGLSEDDASKLMAQVQMAAQAGLQLTDEGIERLNGITGAEYERAPEPITDNSGIPGSNKGKAKKSAKPSTA